MQSRQAFSNCVLVFAQALFKQLLPELIKLNIQSVMLTYQVD